MPHVAQIQRPAIDRRTTCHEGYRLSQRTRKRVEEVFGWVKTVAGGRKLRYCGVERNRFWMELTTASDNLVRLAKLTLEVRPESLLLQFLAVSLRRITSIEYSHLYVNRST